MADQKEKIAHLTEAFKKFDLIRLEAENTGHINTQALEAWRKDYPDVEKMQPPGILDKRLNQAVKEYNDEKGVAAPAAILPSSPAIQQVDALITDTKKDGVLIDKQRQGELGKKYPLANAESFTPYDNESTTPHVNLDEPYKMQLTPPNLPVKNGAAHSK